MLVFGYGFTLTVVDSRVDGNDAVPLVENTAVLPPGITKPPPLRAGVLSGCSVVVALNLNQRHYTWAHDAGNPGFHTDDRTAG